MRRILLAILLVPLTAHAQATPQHVIQTFTLTGNATATAMPMKVGTAGYIIYNGDPTATICVGFSAAVTCSGSTAGLPVGANGGSLPLTVTYQSASTGTVIYIFSASTTASNAVIFAGAT